MSPIDRPELVVQEGVQPGVDVAGPGAHHQALQRGQPHRGLDRDAAAYRRRRAAVAQVQHDLVQLAEVTADQLGRGRRDEPVRGAVEAVAADPVRTGQVGRDRVRRRRRRQGGEEGGVEDRHVGHGELGPRRLDAGHGTRVVQRGQRDQVADLGQHRVVDDHRVGEVGPAVHHPVPDRPEPGRGQVDAGVGQRGGHHRSSPRVVVGRRRRARRSAPPVPLASTSPRLGHQQLVLQRRGPGVEHQDRAVVAHGPSDVCRHKTAHACRTPVSTPFAARAATWHRPRPRITSRHPLGLHRGDGHGVHDVVHQRPPGQVVHRLAQALQHRPDRRRRGRCAAPPCRCCCRCSGPGR